MSTENIVARVSHGGGAATRARAYGSRAVGSYIPALTRKAYERFGFATAEILTDWPRIVGNELSRFTRPERLKWPRETSGDAATSPGSSPGKSAATLILAVDPARALDVEYRAGEIAQRVNAYFGFCAVEKIKVVQMPGLADTPSIANLGPTALPKDPHLDVSPVDLSHVTDEALKATLTGLWANIRRDRLQSA